MKPIKLELVEFGPYHAETIEWSRVMNEPIFLITGKTGAGKSTLFDAIVFALYNGTSGGKANETLRAKNANPTTQTKVIFDFSVKSKKYKITRTLAFTKPGNKTETPSKAELSEEVDSQFKVIATKNVKEEIEKILGLDIEQFRKLIILPQGQFKELLTSGSGEKE